MRKSSHPRPGQLIRWAIAAIVVVFLGLVLYQFYSRRTRFQSNAELLDELADAKIVDLHRAADRPTDWPAWRGTFRDGITRAPALDTQWPLKGPLRLWSAEAG